jgi:ABC-type transport system involved in cytochrome c biogenesis ATPase subunit
MLLKENLDLLHKIIISKVNNGGIIIISSHQKPSFHEYKIIDLGSKKILDDIASLSWNINKQLEIAA